MGEAMAVRVYLRIGRVAAAILSTHELVESVLIRRSVAAGEMSFGRSDIDLAVVIRDPPPTTRNVMRSAIAATRRTHSKPATFGGLGPAT